jgi:hypothetical protein
VQVIRRGGDHLLSLIEGTLDIARIESGKLALQVAPMRFAEHAVLADLFELQARPRAWLPLRRARQPAGGGAGRRKAPAPDPINLLGNAVKFTAQGSVTLRCAMRARWRRSSDRHRPRHDRTSWSASSSPCARGSRRARAAPAWA